MISTMIENFTQNVIINPDEALKLKNETDKRVIFIDSSFVLPSSNKDIYSNYMNKHIEEAIFFDIKEISDKSSPYPNMLPNEEFFSKKISTLGINNDDILIIYGQQGMLMGPARALWMFKGFGHDNVLVLNGGLPAWEKDGLEVQNALPPPSKESCYKASRFNPEMVVQMSDVLNISNNKLHPIIDARPETRFSGKSPEPREAMRSGHIPNSVNIPCSILVNNDGKFKTKEELTKLFENSKINLKDNCKTSKIITTCGSGITACALSLALNYTGHNNVAVYDGSWSEWGLKSSPTPIATAI